MLFKNYIYINEELLIKLSKQLDIEMAYESVKTNQVNKKAGIDYKLSLEKEKYEKNEEFLKKDKYDLLKLFEDKLEEDETGIIDFDFEEACHISTGQLIRFNATILQPKWKSEEIELINSIRGNDILTKIVEEKFEEDSMQNKEILKLLFRENEKSPVIFSNDENYIIVSYINKESVTINYDDFQEYFGEEVKGILLVDRKYTEQQEVVLIDMMKEIFKIGRELRRSFSKEEQDKFILKEIGPAIKGEILALYS